MKIKTVTIAVNYLDLLSYTWGKNKNEIEDYTVITDTSDKDTHKFCSDNGINVYQTDAFYINNDKFSKSSALNEFFASLDVTSTDWILLLDSDIILNNTLGAIKNHYEKQTLDSLIIPNDISVGTGIPMYIGNNKKQPSKLIYKNRISNSNIHNPNDIETEECLFSCAREIYENKLDYDNKKFRIEKCFFYGFFHLFHINAIKDTILSNTNVFNYHKTAATYDMEFARTYWAFPQKKTLNLTVQHLGPVGTNWEGRKSEKWN